MLATIAAIGYGILAAVGGILGYTQAKSQTSLISGIISGILLILGGISHQQGWGWGWWLALGVTVTLMIVFVVRWSQTRKFMPAGLMVVAGILALLGLTA